VDKKSLIGLGLIAVILGVWLYLSGPTKEQIARNKVIRDSIDLVQRKQEIIEANRLYVRMKWPTIDVSRRSVEETAAAILNIIQEHER